MCPILRRDAVNCEQKKLKIYEYPLETMGGADAQGLKKKALPKDEESSTFYMFSEAVRTVITHT